MARKVKILMAVDGSENSQRVARRVGRMVAGGIAGEVTVFHVVRPAAERALSAYAQPWEGAGGLLALPLAEDPEALNAYQERVQAMAERIVGQARELLVAEGVQEADIRAKTVEEVDPAWAIVEEAQRGGYDMTVVGRKGHSALREFLMGGVASKVVQHCASCSVLVVE